MGQEGGVADLLKNTLFLEKEKKAFGNGSC